MEALECQVQICSCFGKDGSPSLSSYCHLTYHAGSWLAVSTDEERSAVLHWRTGLWDKFTQIKAKGSYTGQLDCDFWPFSSYGTLKLITKILWHTKIYIFAYMI